MDWDKMLNWVVKILLILWLVDSIFNLTNFEFQVETGIFLIIMKLFVLDKKEETK